MSWTKLKPIEKAQNKGCLNCGVVYPKLNLRAMLEVGFGGVHISKNGKAVWHQTDHQDKKSGFCEKRAIIAENMARKDPDNDWRLHFDAPLYSSVYQRQDKNTWLLVEKGEGFA